MAAGLVIVVVTTGFAGYHTGSFKKINNWMTARVLDVSASAGFKVKDILITGRSQIPADVLLTHLNIRENMPVFGVNIADTQKAVTNIPWVKSVSVSRILPSTVVISLKEREPVALWQYQKKLSLIDGEGAVLTAEDLGTWKDLPMVVGEDAPAHVTELLGLLNAEPAISGEFVSASRVGKRRWDLRLKNGVVVKLPEKDLGLAIRRLAAAEELQHILGRDIAGVDLRQPDRMVVMPVAIHDGTVEKNKKTNI